MIILTATLTEARPLIDRLGLVLKAKRPFRIFESQEHLLVISGIGKVKAAAALSHILAKTSQPVLNIGYAAGKKVGELYNVHKVIDASSHKVFHLQKSPTLPNGVCTTLERPCEEPINSLADMESSALVECANIYKTSVTILKVVSDTFSPGDMARNSTLLEHHIDTILRRVSIQSRKTQE